MIDLREKDRIRIIALAEKTLPAHTQILAFGSRVKGTNHDTSDLDLVLRSEQQGDFSLANLAAFKQALHDSTIPILIQVLSWWHIPQSFQDNILKFHEVLTVVGASGKNKENEE